MSGPFPDAAGSTPGTPQDVVVVRAQGGLDVVSGPAFRRTVEEAAARSAAPLVLVDMSAVEFVDSAGLAALVGAHRQLPARQQLALVNVPARMQRVLRISGIATLFTVHGEGEPWPWPGISLEEDDAPPQ